MMDLLIRFASNKSGVTAIEYGLIAAVVALGILASVRSVGTTVTTKFYGPLAAGFS